LTLTLKPALAPTPVETSANPKIGINLEGLSDWSRSAMFVDMMKVSRKWGSVATPSDETTATDANG
jgi:hypothetical protein